MNCCMLQTFFMRSASSILLCRSSPTSLKRAAMLHAVVRLGQLTARYNDAQAMLAIGKTALARGLPMEQYAFPEIGVPSYRPIAPPIDRCIVYSIVRTESAFDQRDRSPANAVGLMQVTPEAGRDTAKRFGVAYDWKRLVSDPVYNTQMGAAEVSALFKEYHWLLHHDVCWLQCRPRSRAAMGGASTAIRAIPRSMPSIGSSASRSPRRATTCSVSWRTYRCTARASAPASRRPSPICIERRRSSDAPWGSRKYMPRAGGTRTCPH